jgi:Uma2 family endonuclease
MKHVPSARRETPPRPPLALHNGDRMNQPEFHKRYETCPDDVKFELVGGIVYMASPLRYPHGTYHLKLGAVFDIYASATPGVEGADNTTTILGEEAEPQPDLLLRIVEECGGQSKVDEDDYLQGAPELIAEVAHSSRSMDLNQKKDDYYRSGVLEYVVLAVEEEELHWFHFPSGDSLDADRKGVHRSKVFPGLWIHTPSLLEKKSGSLHRVLRRGLATRSHQEFIKQLARARRRKRT